MGFILHLQEQFVLALTVLAAMVSVTLMVNLSFVWLLSIPYQSPASPIRRGLRKSVENRMVAEHYNSLRWIWAMCLVAACTLVMADHGR